MALIRSFVMAFIQLLGSFNNEGSGKSLKGREKGMFQIELCKKEDYPGGFQMPLHYPRYDKADYESMEDWKLDMLLKEYGLIFKGTLDEKRAFAIGTFFWP
ncbi:hypothetical protein RIF29_18102 [Crotalaria pallida]|uniref:DUF7722 domain-containing protein n=1 Tax=Crotalaria pallida TaxID=3830 RepID=A0AAN9IDL3_CROPI